MTCAVVAVSSGDGISELFRDLGVQVIVAGGQTLNPSTAELLAAVERANADHVVLLPGNKNIIPVAEQVDALTSKTVRVVPTRSMPEGLAALMAYDPEVDAPANVVPMRRAAEAVVTGEVTRAVRASSTRRRGGRRGRLVGHRPRRRHRRDRRRRGRGDEAAARASSAMTDRELITVLTGADAERAATTALERWISDAVPRVEVEVHDGGQPLYPYLFARSERATDAA